jgi:Rrf2 family protein
MLSITSQYALRALALLACQPGNVILGRDLARSAEIPANYLSKVLVILRKAGLVVTSRGSGGGYRLRKSPAEIYLIDVVELFEEVSRTKPSCFLSRTRACSETQPCTAHSSWKELQAAYLKLLISTPLSAISGNSGDTWTSTEENARAENQNNVAHAGGSVDNCYR